MRIPILPRPLHSRLRCYANLAACPVEWPPGGTLPAWLNAEPAGIRRVVCKPDRRVSTGITTKKGHCSRGIHLNIVPSRRCGDLVASCVRKCVVFSSSAIADVLAAAMLRVKVHGCRSRTLSLGRIECVHWPTTCARRRVRHKCKVCRCLVVDNPMVMCACLHPARCIGRSGP